MSLTDKLNILTGRLSLESGRIAKSKLSAKSKLEKEEQEAHEKLREQYKQKLATKEDDANFQRDKLEEEFGKLGAKLLYQSLETDYQILQDRSEYSEVLAGLDEEQLKRVKEAVELLHEQEKTIPDEKQRATNRKFLEFGLRDAKLVNAMNVLNKGNSNIPQEISSYISYADTGQCYIAIPVDGDKNKKLANSLENKITLACSEVSEARIEGCQESLTFSQNLITNKDFLVYELTIQDAKYVEKFSKIIKERIENLAQLELLSTNLTHKVVEIEPIIMKSFIRYNKSELESDKIYVPLQEACRIIGKPERSVRIMAAKGVIKSNPLEETYELASLEKYAEKSLEKAAKTVEEIPEAERERLEQQAYEQLASYAGGDLGVGDIRKITGIQSDPGVLYMINKNGLRAERDASGSYRVKYQDFADYLRARHLSSNGSWVKRDRKQGGSQ